MSPANLTARAQQIVVRIQNKLPAEIRALALKLPVSYHDLPDVEILGDEFESDILGLFVGPHHGLEAGVGNSTPPQIFLFLENIFAESGDDLAIFDEEVRITYLHELGHYLGWDEDEVEERGL
jgi:predicted Zn-dependent protease with MMP-like domain